MLYSLFAIKANWEMELIELREGLKTIVGISTLTPPFLAAKAAL